MATDTTLSESSTASWVSSIASFFVPTVHAEEKPEESDDSAKPEEEEDSEGGEDAEPEAEEEEEEEPEDPAPAIRQDCETSECVAPAKHFKHCSEKVEGGQGWHGEDCVEELFHLMHCVDACAAPKLFKKLA